MDSKIVKYIEAAEVHDSIDYADKSSIRRANKAADKMRYLAQNFLSTKNLVELLDKEHPSALWAAFHLLQLKKIDSEEERLAIKIIEADIEKDGINALGEKYFLEEYRKNKRNVC